MMWEFDDDAEEFFIDENEPVFTSSVVSRLLGIPVWVLKQLDTEEIVSPPRDEGCSRFYSKRDLKKLEYVWFYLHKKKVNVEGLKVILEIEGKLASRKKRRKGKE